jgi:hypothetical protein
MTCARVASLFLFVFALNANAQNKYVRTEFIKGSFIIATSGRATSLFADPSDFPGVLRAVNDLQNDIGRVTQVKPDVITYQKPVGKEIVLIGTIGKSARIDESLV